MSIEDTWFALSASAVFLSLILYVIFGQITVRKLRKNPITQDKLGTGFVSGWEIISVAGALALPRWINRKLRSTPLAFLYADADILDKNTSVFDRVLAIVFYGLFVSSVSSLILLMLLSNFGFFD